jgi:hypothetical protein
MDVLVSMPDQVARQWGDNPKAIGRHVVEDAAIERYRAGRLSHRQAGEVRLGSIIGRPRPFFRNAECR